MIHMFMEVGGPFPRKMLKKGEFQSKHFDDQAVFQRIVTDKTTKKEYIKPTVFQKPTRDLKEELIDTAADLSSEEKRMILQLHDLLIKMFVLDPANRLTIEEALHHPFITGQKD
eukprot:TRINITY_DN522_c0_g1_i2.p3 TRINITY_DN522_c0_g1~~TRINITY_DN522_c0_g1_i2.p3  ORF type:complete len:114 (+),score=39.69 TRINITY_DN522_c0_g1_i2:741-1082(+)